MTIPFRIRLAVYGIAASILLLGGAGWWHHLRIERAHANAFLLKSLGEIQLIDSSLHLLDQGRLDTARKMLEMRLVSALGSAEEMNGLGARMYPFVWPNLKESLRRAGERARRDGNPGLASRVEKLAAALEEHDREGEHLGWLDALL